MWTRKELKQQAKAALQQNYWKTVLVTFLAVILGIGSSFSFSGAGTAGKDSVVDISAEYTDNQNVLNADENVVRTDRGMITGIKETLNSAAEEMSDAQIVAFGVMMAVIFVIVYFFVTALIYARVALLNNPFYIGVCRFMLKNVNDKAEVKEIAYGFDHSYKNVVKTMFHSDLRVFAWALLFIVPGIYKRYQYRMVPYILAERPDMNYREVLQLSSDIMYGEKWHAFVLDFSFILWHILGLITCGIIEILFVSPYVYLTHAALYRRLCELRNERGTLYPKV